MGYLTNPAQEAQLLSGEFQARLADALTEAVAQFFAGVPPLPPQAAASPAPGAAR
jgi:hypothetical protein